MRIRRAIDRIFHRSAEIFAWRLLTILAGLVLAISLIGFLYLKRQQTTARAEAWRTGLMVSLLLVAVVLAAAYLWWQRHAGLLRHELALERESKALAERLALLTRHANDIILLLDETGRIVEANDRALTTYGYTLDELRQLPPDGLRPPVAQENLPQQLDRFASPDGAVFETVHQRRDGTTFPVEVSGRSVESKGRQFSLGICRDITARKQAEAALRGAEEQYRSIFENVIEGVFQTTPNGAFLAVNPAMARILGYASPEALIRERTDIGQQGYVDPHCREDFKHRIEADGVVSGFEYEAYRKDGSKVWLSENARMVRDEHGQTICYEGTLEDITARKQAGEALVRQAAELRARNEELERFNRAATGRELRMVELKKQINELCRQMGKPLMHQLDFLDAKSQTSIPWEIVEGRKSKSET